MTAHASRSDLNGRGGEHQGEQLYNTAGPCIECDHRECLDTEEGLDTYAVIALEYREEEGLTCKRNGLAVRNYDDTSDRQQDIVHDLDERIEKDSEYSNGKLEEDINTSKK